MPTISEINKDDAEDDDNNYPHSPLPNSRDPPLSPSAPTPHAIAMWDIYMDLCIFLINIVDSYIVLYNFYCDYIYLCII
jgi:hypothetical protein